MNLSEYLKIEQQIESDLWNIKWRKFPVWRMFRSEFRTRYLQTIDRTIDPEIKLIEALKNSCKSFIGLIGLLFKPRRSNVFFPFPRVFSIGNYYIDRLFDPVIDYSDCKNDYVILERHQKGRHFTPRYHHKNIIYLDSIDNVIRALFLIVNPFYKRLYNKDVDALYEMLNQRFTLNDESYKTLFKSLILNFKLNYFFYSLLIRFLKPKNIFVAPRSLFPHIINIAKEKGVCSFEMQHGIVFGQSITYSGCFCDGVDPDYFLVFGKDNVGEQYGMPLNKVINIGFPFKNFITDKKFPMFDNNIVLLISEPHITDKIIQIAILLLELTNNKYIFHIRCHPEEQLSIEQKELIGRFENIIHVGNDIESFVALSQYKTVLGEISSVVYEALSLNKKVGLLNFGGLQAIQTKDIYGGIYLNRADEFEEFMQSDDCLNIPKSELYSDFNAELFNNLLTR